MRPWRRSVSASVNLSGSEGISNVNGPLLSAEDKGRNDKEWFFLTIFSISIGAFHNLKIDFLWIKQSKHLYEIMFISLYEWGVYWSTKFEDPKYVPFGIIN